MLQYRFIEVISDRVSGLVCMVGRVGWLCHLYE